MNVALINMPFSEHEYTRFSEKWSFIEDEYFGINIVHTLLEAGGWRVARFDGCSESELLKGVLSDMPDIVMISVMETSAENVRDFARSLRTYGYRGKIFIGGWFAKLSWKRIFADEWPVDYVCYTDAEGVFPRWMKDMDADIPGIATYANWKTTDHGVLKALRETNDWPATYVSPRRKSGRNTYRLETSRGCPHSRCTFCSLSRANVIRNMWTSLPINVVIDEMKKLHDKYGATRFSLTDDDMLGPLSDAERRAEELCAAFRSLPFVVRFSGSISVRAALNGRILDLLVSAGLEQLGIGFESADADQLRRYCKQQTLEENFVAAKNITDRSISLIPGLITFDPFATRETVRKNLSFLYENLGHYDLGKLTKRLHVIRGTPMESMVRSAGLLIESRQGLEYSFKYPETGCLYDDLCAYSRQVADLQKAANRRDAAVVKAVGGQHRKVAESILGGGQWRDRAEHAVKEIRRILEDRR